MLCLFLYDDLAIASRERKRLPLVNDALRQTFKPEFLNRIDDVVVFQSLGLADIEQIVDIQLKDVRKRLARERITLELSGAAIQSRKSLFCL